MLKKWKWVSVFINHVSHEYQNNCKTFHYHNVSHKKWYSSLWNRCHLFILLDSYFIFTLTMVMAKDWSSMYMLIAFNLKKITEKFNNSQQTIHFQNKKEVKWSRKLLNGFVSMPSKLPLVYFESQTKVLGIGIQQNEEETVFLEKKSIFLQTFTFLYKL